MKNNFLEGIRVGVLGMARSGIAAANLAKSLGADVLISEVRSKKECAALLSSLAKGIKTEFGRHSDRLLECGLIIKSPGIPHNLPIIKELKKSKIPLWGEIELAARVASPRRVIAITGTNGKTTTTTLMGELCKAARRDTIVAGNIGAPYAAQISAVHSSTEVVLEVSSYQLEDCYAFRPRICAILNVTPDHIEHHRTMQNYIDAKARIFKNQTPDDTCVLNYDDKLCRPLARHCPGRVVFFSAKKALRRGVYLRSNSIVVRLAEAEYSFPLKLKIPGMHNIENALAATAMAARAGIGRRVIERTLASFGGVEHRIEFVAEKNNVSYINDSKGTNVDSTVVALRSFDRPVWLILGGRDKGSPYAPLRVLIKKKVKGILLIGEAAVNIQKELAGTTTFHNAGTLKKAVTLSAKLAREGDVVLLSPACASFDQFTDYEDRGRQFKKFVGKL